MAKHFTVKNEADKQAAELLIYDRIGKETGSGIDAKDVKTALDEIPKEREIVCRINSPGGNLWDGMAIYSMLAERRQRVVCQVDGIAASTASLIAIAGRETVMPANAMMMIHLPSIMACGNAKALRQEAERLDKHTDTLTACYGRKTGRSETEIMAKMESETWFSGSEAHDFGLCDRVTDEVAIAALASEFDFSKFERTPDALKVQGYVALHANGFLAESPEDALKAQESLLDIYRTMLSVERLKAMAQSWGRKQS